MNDVNDTVNAQSPTSRYPLSGSAAGSLLTLTTTHRGAEAPRIHLIPTCGPRRTTITDHKPRRRGNAEQHVLTRGHQPGGARPTGPGRWGERHGGHKRRDAVVPLVIVRSLAPSRAFARATRTPQSHATVTYL